MTDNNVQIEGGQVLANLEERTISGRLIPFNEEGRTNQGRFTVEPGTVDISEATADPSFLGINTDHIPWQNVGRGMRVWEQADGVYASWSIVRTPAGDAALQDAISPAGKRKRLSAEFGPVVIRAGKLVAGHARLWGSALVPAGAFAGAMVLAADTPDPEPIQTPDPAPAVAEPTGGNTMPEPLAPVAAPAVDPAPVLAPPAPVPVAINGLPAAVVTEPPGVVADDSRQVLAALASLRTNPRDADAMQVLAAIADITMSGTNTLPGANTLRPNWLGKLYQGIPYVREYAQLCNLGTEISAAGKLGMKVVRGTAASPLGPQDGTWVGNKQPINGYRGDSSTVGSLLYRFAVGNDIDRSLYDLPGGWEVVQEFLQLIIEDYLFWSDRLARETILAAAGAPVAAKTYPAIYTTNGTTALGMLIQGILAVRKRKADGRRDQPTFAILNDLAFEQIAYAVGGDQNLPAFITLALSALNVPQSEIGQLGNVIAVNGDNGIIGTPSVTVGSKMGIDFDELAGGPLVIDAIDLARGGIDKATHGYFQTFTKRPESFVTIGTADAWAATTAVVTGQYMKNGAATLQALNAGTTGAAAPTNPAVGANVTDGTVTWKRLA
ncbi:hypothetical protein [Microbacterium rhizomatis]|uniref:Uncharacterized protein n=1 Tax=Microbacterium rhizomatis TaxID=1631477 RepID=A0A5J5IVI9_9MICO|nr:hypothetical protein [Microbacterium rhizomatis]KAA9105010.1 hypothetical protein F6B43_18350 [Microbacterium rhizomatis]